jgi:hypothetical protein
MISIPPRVKAALLVVLAVLAVVFWDTMAVYPIKLFVVVLHEASHGLAAVATGGSIQAIEINEAVGGSCLTEGGSSLIIASSGYVGSMVLGCLVFVCSMKRFGAQVTAWIISAGIGLLTVLYVENSFGFLFGIAFSVALLLLSVYVPDSFLDLFMQFLGATSCLYALVDLREDLFANGTGGTDAEILANMTGTPAMFWAILWAGFALLVFVLMLRAAYKNYHV